jgi:ABC-2 type transport system permease protein
MNWRAIFAITRKDLKVVSQSKAVLYPLILVPVILTIFIPALFGFILQDESATEEFTTEMSSFFENLPDGIRSEIDSYESDNQRILYLVIVYQLAPMFLILPVLVSSVLAADSFAGEKERKTLEALIYSPATDGEIYIGKMLAAWIPAIIVGGIGAAIYCITANIVSWPIMQQIFIPNLMWIVMIILVAPAAAGLGLAAMVLVSSRVRSVQEATQLGGLVVIPIVLLMLSQFAGAMYFSVEVVIVIGLILWMIDAALLWYGAKSFNRSELIAQL